jgi:hypothetical protein
MSRKRQKNQSKNLTQIYLLCTSTEKRKDENLTKNSSGKPLQKNDKFSLSLTRGLFSPVNSPPCPLNVSFRNSSRKTN